MNLQTIVFLARAKIKDLGLRRWTEPELVAAANEGKNQLVKIIRQAREDFFFTTTTGTISTTTAPNPSTVTLPSDFIELKDLRVTSNGYESIDFVFLDRVDPKFRYALQMGGDFSGGGGVFYYDIMGMSTLVLAPGSDIEMSLAIDYIQYVPNMTLPSDTVASIPEEHQDYIVNHIVCECLRETGDPNLRAYLLKLERQADSIMQAVGDVQVREPTFVRGFMEEEFW